MPQPNFPPFESGAVIIPRTLKRWLGVNYQGGPLTRTMTYITLPVFNADVTWAGYSDIVTAFNVEAPNNFSINSAIGSVGTPNFTLCISYRVGAKLTRYIIWQASGSVMDVNIPMYEGQPILKNFRLEVWSTSQGNASQATAINFYTTVGGEQDYRYGVDQPLAGNDGQVVNFTDISGFLTPQTVPTTVSLDGVDADVIQQWDNAGFQSNFTTWIPSYSLNAPVNLVGTNAAAGYPFGNGHAVEPTPGITNWTATIATFSSVIISFIPVNVAGYTLRCAGLVTIQASGTGTYSINGQVDSRITTNTKCTVVVRVNAGVAEAAVYPIWYGVASESDFVTVPHLGSNTATSVIVFDGSAMTGKVAELVCITSYDDLNPSTPIMLPANIVQQYLNWIKPIFTNTFVLPITFPTNAVSTTN